MLKLVVYFTFSFKIFSRRIYRNGKNLLYFLSFSIIKISPHTKNRLHLFSILSFLFLLLRLSIYIADNLFIIGKISRHTILINIILITVPKSFKFPFLRIREWLLNGMHQFNTNSWRIILTKETKNNEIQKKLVMNAWN